MNDKKVIGTNAFSYPEMRNFAGHSFETFSFKKVMDYYKLPSFILYRLKNKINRKWQNNFKDFGLNRCAFFHFFNVVNSGPQPFITTYETAIPRWSDSPEDFKKGLGILAKNNCKKIIAISDCAYKRQTGIIEKYRPDLYEKIMDKNIVLLPPQPLFIDHINEKRKLSDPIIFTIVGADFFRKGGQAVLNVFKQLFDDKKTVRLNIVSTLNFGDYASKTTRDDYENALSIIKEYPEQIHFHRHLKNKEVKSLLLNTDVALLPSLAETFGYFILEAQAAGCPVISTDIRAMPEINNEEIGWLINIRKENGDDADIDQPNLLIEKITKDLYAIINAILDNPALIVQKGERALLNIREKHSPEKHREKLLNIYNTI